MVRGIHNMVNCIKRVALLRRLRSPVLGKYFLLGSILRMSNPSSRSISWPQSVFVCLCLCLCYLLFSSPSSWRQGSDITACAGIYDPPASYY